MGERHRDGTAGDPAAEPHRRRRQPELTEPVEDLAERDAQLQAGEVRTWAEVRPRPKGQVRLAPARVAVQIDLVRVREGGRGTVSRAKGQDPPFVWPGRP